MENQDNKSEGKACVASTIYAIMLAGVIGVVSYQKGFDNGYHKGDTEGRDYMNELWEDSELKDLKSIERRDYNGDGIEDVILKSDRNSMKFLGTKDGKLERLHSTVIEEGKGIIEHITVKGTRLPFNKKPSKE